MATYIHPSSIIAIGDDFAAHVRRGSVNPGDDYQTPVGTPFWSVAAGTVAHVWTGFAGSGGRQVWVNHAGGAQSQYLHLDTINVSLGQSVAQGQRLGTTGSSANGKARGGVGPHLHFSLKINGKNVDFQKYVTLTVLPGSRVNADQVKQLLNWLGNNRAYNTYAYWHDIQSWAIGIGAYPANQHDGVPGPLTFAGELAVWNHYLAPKPLEPNQRKVLPSAAVNVRDAADTSGVVVSTFKAGSVVTMSGWRAGEEVSGNDVWFTPDGRVWAWSGGFEDTDPHDLEDLTPQPEPEPEPDPEPKPDPEPEPGPDPEPDPEPKPVPTPEQPKSPLVALITFLTISVAAWFAWLGEMLGWW